MCLKFEFPCFFISERVSFAFEAHRHNKNADLLVGVRDDTDRKNLDLVKGLQALSTHIEPARLAVYHHRALGDVGMKLAVSAPLRKAHIVPKLRTLATHFTLSHWNHLFTK